MTEKRFRVQEHCVRSSYGIEAENWLVINDNHCVVLNDKAEAHMVANMCNDVIDVLNALHEENVKLQARNKYLATKIQRERNSHMKQHEKWEEEIQKENEQLKQSSTMYYNLFKELQRQMQGVKSIYDLDSKDFEDLIELSKGNVFDDEIGWIHLPIKELEE